MNTLTPQSLKKLLYALGLSLLIIIIFLLFKVFFYEQKVIPSHSFNTALKTDKKTEVKKEKTKTVEKSFMLLPKEVSK